MDLRLTAQNLIELGLGGAAVAGTTIASPLFRRRYNRWGTTDTELAASMPGDELVANPKLGYTRAVTIDAVPSAVWPWLAQIGRGRGGFYSYDALENVVGCGIDSADRILPEHQALEVGDVIRSGPDNYPCWMVREVDPERHLVLLGAGTPEEISVPEEGGQGAVSTWQWQLQPRDEGSRTRLLVRQRLDYDDDQATIWRLFEPVNFAMERKMLLGIKERSERHVSG